MSLSDVCEHVHDTLSELYQRSASIKKESATIASIEVFFTAKSACPLNMVARSVAKLITPIINNIGLTAAVQPNPLGRNVMEACADLVMSCVQETSLLRQQCDTYRQELSEAGGAKTVADLKDEVAALQREVSRSHNELESIGREHLGAIESFIVKLGDAQLNLRKKEEELIAVFREIDELREKNSLLQMENQHLRETAKAKSDQRDDRFLDELAHVAALKGELRRTEERVVKLQHDLVLASEQRRMLEEKAAIQLSETEQRVSLLQSANLEHYSLVTMQPVRVILSQCNTLRAQLTVLRESNSENFQNVFAPQRLAEPR